MVAFAGGAEVDLAMVDRTEGTWEVATIVRLEREAAASWRMVSAAERRECFWEDMRRERLDGARDWREFEGTLLAEDAGGEELGGLVEGTAGALEADFADLTEDFLLDLGVDCADLAEGLEHELRGDLVGRVGQDLCADLGAEAGGLGVEEAVVAGGRCEGGTVVLVAVALCRAEREQQGTVEGRGWEGSAVVVQQQSRV